MSESDIKEELNVRFLDSNITVTECVYDPDGNVHIFMEVYHLNGYKVLLQGIGVLNATTEEGFSDMLDNIADELKYMAQYTSLIKYGNSMMIPPSVN